MAATSPVGSSPAVSFGKAKSRSKARADDAHADEHTAILSNDQTRSYNTTNSSSASSSRSAGQGKSNGKGNRNRPSDTHDGNSDDDDGQPKSWAASLRAALDKYGSVELENKGSVARDHLALERTFLAWLRTSLSFASIGIAVTQLFRLNSTLQHDDGSSADRDSRLRLRHVGKPLGATFLVIGIVTLLIGFFRYFEAQHYVIRGKFPASRGSISLMTFLTAALIVASFVVVLTIAPKALLGR